MPVYTVQVVTRKYYDERGVFRVQADDKDTAVKAVLNQVKENGIDENNVSRECLSKRPRYKVEQVFEGDVQNTVNEEEDDDIPDVVDDVMEYDDGDESVEDEDESKTEENPNINVQTSSLFDDEDEDDSLF